MRIALLLLTAAAVTQAPASQVPVPRPIVPMNQLMLKVILPYSDAIFYVERDGGPQNEVEWMELESKALALAEIGNLMMSPVRARNEDQWMKDAQLLVDAASSAYKGAQARNVKTIADLNADLYEACQSCHVHYRPGYRRRP